MSNNTLKHQNIINSLSNSQKLRLLADLCTVNDEDFFSIGIPKIKFYESPGQNNCGYLSPFSVSRSWNTELIESVAISQLSDVRSRDNNLIELPFAKTTVSPYGIYTAEDPLVVEKVCRCYINAAQKLSLMPVISEFEISNDEKEFLDKEPDERDVYEYIAKPYIDILRKSKTVSLAFSSSVTDGENDKINRYFSSIAEKASSVFVLSTNPAPNHTVSEILNKRICIKGSYKNIHEANENYKKLCQNISEGKNTSHDLEVEIAQGRAISDESIDAAVDNLIEFAFECNKQGTDTPISENYPLENVVSESSVLLKNKDHILPIKSTAKKKKICVIGSFVDDTENDGGFASLLSSYNFEVQYIKGYERNDQRGVLNTGELRLCAAKADYIILNLSTPPFYEDSLSRRGSLNLPANQIAMTHALSEYSQKIIAVVSSNYSVNMPFAREFAAVLLVPGNMTANGYNAVLEMLVGKTPPSGKLTSTIYYDYESENKNLLAYKRAGAMKTGAFIGYRYYDSNGFFDGFPFGFGMSYTKFNLSDLKINGKKITVTVKNVGKYIGSETIQVYVQKNRSALLRPQKELAAFTKITLRPHETKKVSLELEIPSIFDPSADDVLLNRFSPEDGEYTVFVATSLSDIKLKGRLKIKGKIFDRDSKKAFDYLQSVSNIISDNYTLEANCANMKRSIKNIIYSLIMMLMSLCIGVYCGISQIDDNFFTFVSVILLISSLSLLFYDIYERAKIKKREAEELDKITNENFLDAAQVSVLTSENMFINEFDFSEESETPEISADEKSNAIDELSYVDNDFDFQNAMDEFELLLGGVGYRMSRDSVRCLFSSLAASRLVVLNHSEKEHFAAISTSLNRFFVTEVYFDTVDETISTEYDLLFGADSEGNKIPRAMSHALDRAAKEPEKVFIIALDNVVSGELPKFFAPFLKYIHNPMLAGEFSISDDQNTSTQYMISPNIRFILNLNKSENISDLPVSIVESAAVLSIESEKLDDAQEVNANSLHKMNHYQLVTLTERSKQNFSIEEKDWKKIDKLEDYIASRCGYKFGNKLLVSMESFASVYMSCGGEITKAVDRCIACKLLPVLVHLLNDNPKEGQPSLAKTINSIFEETDITETRKVLAECLSVSK